MTFVEWMAYDAPTWLVVVLVWLCISPTFLALMWLAVTHARWSAARRRRSSSRRPRAERGRW